MKVDPAASMRQWEIEVDLADQVFTVPAMPASDWWPILISPTMDLFFDVLVSKDDFDLDMALLSGTLTGEEVLDALMDAVEEVTGRSYHAAMVLAVTAEAQWPVIGGQLASHGFRWDLMPIGAALDAIYLTLVNGLEEEARQKLEAFLDNDAISTPKKRRRAPDRSEFEQIAGPMPTTGALSSGVPSDNARPRTRRQPRPLLPDDPSSAPTPPPVPPGRNGRRATTGNREAVAAPASGTTPPPPP